MEELLTTRFRALNANDQDELDRILNEDESHDILVLLLEHHESISQENTVAVLVRVLQKGGVDRNEVFTNWQPHLGFLSTSSNYQDLLFEFANEESIRFKLLERIFYHDNERDRLFWMEYTQKDPISACLSFDHVLNTKADHRTRCFALFRLCLEKQSNLKQFGSFILQTPLLLTLMKCLQYDCSVDIIKTGIDCLLRLLPAVARKTESFVPTLIMILTRLLHLTFPLSEVAAVLGDELPNRDLPVTVQHWQQKCDDEFKTHVLTVFPDVSLLFSHIYALFPQKLIEFIRERLDDADDPRMDAFIFSEMLLQHTFHPSLADLDPPLTVDDEDYCIQFRRDYQRQKFVSIETRFGSVTKPSRNVQDDIYLHTLVDRYKLQKATIQTLTTQLETIRADMKAAQEKRNRYDKEMSAKMKSLRDTIRMQYNVPDNERVLFEKVQALEVENACLTKRVAELKSFEQKAKELTRALAEASLSQ